jgi:Fe-S-cluster-containing dehydrogenase component
MRNGFIFNFDLCVNCKACNAACLLENNWSVSARNIYIYNLEVLPGLPITHLSLACNHCEKPLCLDGCPTGAFRKDFLTSAIIIENRKCIGCSYCTWNCPYDAPKLNVNKGFMEKCNFCFSRINEGVEPACTAACPTGALRFGEVPEIARDNILKWVPGKDINPSLLINGSKTLTPLIIFPENRLDEQRNAEGNKEKNISGEWSLILFSFLTVISVSFGISDLLGGRSVNKISAIIILILAVIFSLFHLQKKPGALEAVLNFKSSPLSREIVFFAVYFLFSVATQMTGNPALLMISVIIGLLLLMAIDSVYTYADRSVLMIFHSGQTFLTGLLIGSYLLNALFPFMFIASVKVLFNLYCLIRSRPGNLFFTLRILRVAFLLIISAAMISGKTGNDFVNFIIFLSGEFADRILYYADFEPVNINSEITKLEILSQNEKERN